jgi:hypothetical protein
MKTSIEAGGKVREGSALKEREEGKGGEGRGGKERR